MSESIDFKEFCNRLHSIRKKVGDPKFSKEQCNNGMKMLRISYLSLNATQKQLEDAALFMHAWEDEYAVRMAYRK